MNNSKNSKNKAIKIKLANLINATPKDICIRTRITNFSFDLSKYFSSEEITDFLNRKIDELILSNAKSRDVLQDELNSFHSADSFINYLLENDIFLAKTRSEKLQHNFEKYKESTIQLILSKISLQNKKIDLIIKRNKLISDNTGIYSLYLGSNFLLGLTSMNTQINAPLILYPIEISYKEGIYKIRHAQGFNRFVINEKLLSLLFNEYKLNFSVMDIVNECYKSNSINPILNVLKNSLKKEIEINDEFNNFVENPDFLLFSNFKINNSYVCGIFEPTGGALKADLEKLIKMNVDPFESDIGFTKNKFINDEINGQNLISIGRPLNIYQKYAIRSSLNQNTIIFGPPGTGKSEVITNIIINALARNKSTLLVTEKRVALDVIMERLGDVSDFSLFISDFKNKSEFYSKILLIADKLENMMVNIESKQDENVNNYLINTIQKRDELKQHFHNLELIYKKPDSNGTTFNEYLDLLSQVDKHILQFVKENNSLQFLDRIVYYYSFSSIEDFFTKINEYKRFLTDYKISSDFVDNLKQQKEKLIFFDINYNFLNFIKVQQKSISKLQHKFISFLETTKLINNRRFLNNLEKDVMLLKKQRIGLIELKNLSPLFDKNLLSYMINQSSKIDSIVNKLSNFKFTNQFDVLFKNFLLSTKINNYIDIDLDLSQDKYQEYFKIFKKFTTIENNDEKYLLDLCDLENDFIVDQNIVLMYFNQWLNNKYIIELGEKSLIFFSNNDILNSSAISNISSSDYEIIRKILTFENEIIKNNNVLNIDLSPLVNSYRLEMINDVNNITKIISQHFLNLLKLKLSTVDENTKQKIREIFSISRRDSKKNVPIKEFISNYYNELKIIFPIWISMPELIAQTLPLEKNIFDYGIFDEASQIFMERAYPIVYRTNIKIVAGDDKQLKPTSFFTNRIDDELQNYEYSDNDQVDSLLDRAKVSLWSSYHLKNHYRSNHRDLIQFSNDYIYDHSLEFVNKNGIVNHGIETINVEGLHIDGVNKEEATLVYELLLNNINNYKKIIVVTFGVKQSAYIEQLIVKNISLSQDIYNKYTNGDLIVCSLENVQGNEADLIILTTTYGKDITGSFRGNFGPIFMDGGINRLNVAITRAKSKMIVVKSFLASEMVINLNNPNAKMFYQFINYCDHLGTEAKNHSLSNKNISNISNKEIVDLINKEIEDKPNYYLVENYDIGSKIIDFAIIDKNTNQTILAIIINKLSQNDNIQKMFEVLDNYYFIIDRGYNTYYLDKYYWICNKQQATNKLLSIIRKI